MVVKGLGEKIFKYKNLKIQKKKKTTKLQTTKKNFINILFLCFIMIYDLGNCEAVDYAK